MNAKCFQYAMVMALTAGTASCHGGKIMGDDPANATSTAGDESGTKDEGDDGDDGDDDADEGDGETGDGGGDSGDEDEESGDEGPPPECQPGEDDGKCQDGHKCSPTLKTPDSTWVDHAHCVPVMGDQGRGDDCERNSVEGNDDCASGLFCFAGCTACGGMGYCEQLCDARSPEVQAEACQRLGLDNSFYCFKFNEGFFPVCIETCHPIEQDCPDGEGCYQSADPEYMCSVFNPPMGGGDGKQGEPCNLVQECRPGLQCMAATTLADCDATNCCSYNCDLDASDPNAICEVAGEECIAMLENPPPGKENVGVCALPNRARPRLDSSPE